MDSSTYTKEVFIPLVAAGAAASVASLALLQTDRVSRGILSPPRLMAKPRQVYDYQWKMAVERWMLSPPCLMAKRRQEYEYRWKTAVERAHLQLDYCLAGGSDKFNLDPEVNLKNTNFLSSEEEQDSLVERIVSKKEKASIFSVLKIDRDPSDPMGYLYLFLMREQEDCAPEFFQLPLVPFCLKLREAFENQLTTTAFCFVADASSGKASDLLEQLVKEAKTGVAVVSEPLWMVSLARLAEARIYADNNKLQAILFALCRLDAWALREQAKASDTVMFTLPGQSTVAALLPLVQAAFPEDRHVFAYDDCVASVDRSLRQNASFRRGLVHSDLGSIISKLAQHPVRHTTPLPSKMPLTKCLYGLERALANVPVSQAQVVESWMSSVDAFFRLKDDKTKNGYIPHVFNLKYLTKPIGNFAPLTDSFCILSSLLEFVTGTRSRSHPIPDGIMDAAREFLKDYNRDNADPSIGISAADSAFIENCVFRIICVHPSDRQTERSPAL